MMTLDIQNLNPIQREALISSYQEKIGQLQFQVLKMRRTIAKRQAQEQKWLEDLSTFQQRIAEGVAALQVLSEGNPYYHKIRLDVQKCEIKIMELEIRLQRFTLVQKAEKITKIMALEATISYYQALIVDLQSMPQPIQSLKKEEDMGDWLIDSDFMNQEEIKDQILQSIGKASILHSN